MNKKIKILLLVILITTIAIVFLGLYISKDINNNPIQENTKKVKAQPTTLSLKVKTLINMSLFFKGETKNDVVFKDSTNKYTVSLKALTDIEHQARNTTYDLYINDKKIGEIGGQGIISYGFSPDNHYLALRIRNTMGCAGMCQDFQLFVIDVFNGEIIPVKLPNSYTYATNKGEFFDIVQFIESVTWDKDKLKGTFYFVGLEETKTLPVFYRISYKEIWQYDLVSKDYALIETLPEL